MTLGAPLVAFGQQGGLFPLAPIKRERVPCPMEDPVYQLYRQQYFGYHPTCWRKFPNGWGCPSPEAPNTEADFRKRPRDKPLYGDEGEAPMDGDLPLNEPPAGGDAGGPNPLPPVPEDPGVFGPETKPGGAAPANPNALPPVDTKPPENPPAAPPGNASAPKPPINNQLEPLAPAASVPPELPPISSLSEPSAPVATPPTTSIEALPPTTGTSISEPAASVAPAQAPRRTSLIGNLFGGFSGRRR
jgi:hypothetical protein